MTITIARPSALMTAEEVAAYVGVPLRTLYAWRQSGQGPAAHRVGRYLRYRRETVDGWLAASESRFARG
jgi:excisionase family DNA binding protein